MEKAQKACQPILRNAIGEPSAEERAAMEEAALEFAVHARARRRDRPTRSPARGIRDRRPRRQDRPGRPDLPEGAEGLREHHARGRPEGRDGGAAAPEAATHRPGRRRRGPRHRPGHGRRLDRLRRRARGRRGRAAAVQPPPSRTPGPATTRRRREARPQSTAEVERRDLITREESRRHARLHRRARGRQPRPGHAHVDAGEGSTRAPRRRPLPRRHAARVLVLGRPARLAHAGGRDRRRPRRAPARAEPRRAGLRPGQGDRRRHASSTTPPRTRSSAGRRRRTRRRPGRSSSAPSSSCPARRGASREVQGTVGGQRRRRDPLDHLDAPRGDVRHRRPRRRPGARGQAACRSSCPTARSCAAGSRDVGRVATGGSDDPAAEAEPTIEVTVRLDAGKGVDAVRPGAGAGARRDGGRAGRARRSRSARCWRWPAAATRWSSPTPPPGAGRGRRVRRRLRAGRPATGIDEGTRVVQADL